MEDATIAFRTRLREGLARRRMSQTELARQLGVRVATVNEWLNRGTMPSGPIMLRLPGILSLDGHWLLTGERRAAGGAPLPSERRERVAALLEEALRLLGEPEEEHAGAGEGRVGRVRKPREDEQRALEAVELHRRAGQQPARARPHRKSG